MEDVKTIDSSVTKDIPQSVAGVEVEAEAGVGPTTTVPAAAAASSSSIGMNTPSQHDGDSVMESMEIAPSSSSSSSTTNNNNTTTPAAKSSATTTTTTTTTPSTTKSKSKPKTPNTPSSSQLTSKVPSYLLKISSNGKATYLTMVHEAIVELKNRAGSSVPAIQKFMISKYIHLQNDTTKQKKKAFNTNVYNALKSGIKEERFVKIRNSYKINTAWLNKQKAAFKAKENKKKAAEKKRKKEMEKLRIEKEKKKKEEKEREMKERERKLLEKKKEAKIVKVAVLTIEKKVDEEAKKREKLLKAEADKKAQILAERIRKRKFPMDDLKLIAEDRELGIKRPPGVSKQVFLPFTMSSLIPFDDRPTTRKTTSTTIVNASSATMSLGSRSLISDVLQLYHFFRGDVGYSRLFPYMIPEFNLKHLLYAVNEIMIGNARKSQLIPPLISQLFYASLKILTDPQENDWMSDSEDEKEKRKWKALKNDLVKLGSILDEASWGETLMCYIDLMERFNSSDATFDSNVVPGFPITLVPFDNDDDDDNDGDKKMSEDKVNVEESGSDNTNDFVDGYFGYIGPADGAIYRGFTKLVRSDPWCLTAEELIAMLRVLTDDILAMKADMGEEFVKRDSESMELFKAKKAADSYFRKIRLAYEGPKWPTRPKPKKPTTDDEKNGDKSTDNPQVENAKVEETEQKKFKPTATKDEFEAAEKARIKATEQYEKGMKNLVLRTEPIGQDRNFNTYYFFHHDPGMIHVEMNRNAQDSILLTKSWHCIDHKSTFDEVNSTLDLRGVREYALHETLIGTSGGPNLKRYLSDNNKKNSLIQARKREEEAFERRLNNALIASADQGRRSGRLANVAKDGVAKIQQEMELARKEFEKQLEIESNGPDYRLLTGIEVVSEFESNYKVDTCFSKFCETDSNISRNISVITSKILNLENFCEELDPWEQKDLPRAAWISNIKDITQAYERGSHLILGPKVKCLDDEKTPSKRQRRSLESTPSPLVSSSSLAQVLSALKDPLLELEKRIYSIAGLERAVNEADDANANLAADSDDEMSEEEKALKKTEKIQLAWKRKINTLKYIETRRSSAVREVLIAAIVITRKGPLDDVLADLRNALHLHRPGAAGKARQMALAVLEKYGGYSGVDDETTLAEDEGDYTDSDDEKEYDESSENFSYLCGEAMMLMGCLEGDNNADRVDWKDAVIGCKTVSRFSALSAALASRALPKLQKLSDDRDTLKKAIKYWEANAKARRSRSSKKKIPKEKYNSATEIWTNTNQTDEFVMGKVEGYPWWPARICEAKNPSVKASLESLDRVLISFIGERHLHVVKREDEIKPFTGTEQEDKNIGDYPSDTVKNLRESTAMARRILRGSALNDDKGFAEEKKSSM